MVASSSRRRLKGKKQRRFKSPPPPPPSSHPALPLPVPCPEEGLSRADTVGCECRLEILACVRGDRHRLRLGRPRSRRRHRRDAPARAGRRVVAELPAPRGVGRDDRRRLGRGPVLEGAIPADVPCLAVRRRDGNGCCAAPVVSLSVAQPAPLCKRLFVRGSLQEALCKRLFVRRAPTLRPGPPSSS